MFCVGLFKTLRLLELRLPFIDEATLAVLQDPHPVSVYGFWAMFMVLPWCLLLLIARGASGKKLLELRTESGSKINVRKRAISAYIKDCLDTMSFVRDVRVHTQTQRGALALELRVWVAATDKMDSLQQRLIDTVTDDLQRGFGIARIIEPKIIIEAVKSAPRRKGSSSRRTKHEDNKSLLAPETAALSAPELMSEKEVLDYSAVDESDTDDKQSEESPSESSGFGASLFGSKSGDEEKSDEVSEDTQEGEEEK